MSDTFRNRVHNLIENEFRYFNNINSFDPLDVQFLKNDTFGNANFSFSSDAFVDGKNFVVKCELPGIDKKNIKIYFEGNHLIIKGEKKYNKEEQNQKKNYYLKEMSYGSFSRAYVIPSSADKKSIKATMKDGVLTITLKIKEQKSAPQKLVPIN